MKRRAGGRRHYNDHRKIMAVFRRLKILRLAGTRMFDHGVCAELARKLGVHRSTVWRDIRFLLAQSNAFGPCPHCGKPVPPRSVQLVDLEGEPLPREPERDPLVERILADADAEAA